MNKFSSVSEIEASYNVKLPATLREFIEAEKWRPLDGHFIGTLPSYDSDPHTGMKVSFGDVEPADSCGDWDVEWSSFPGHIPFASIVFPDDGCPDAQFLAVRVSAENCAVLMWEHETGEMDEVAGSLGEFLDTLVAA